MRDTEIVASQNIAFLEQGLELVDGMDASLYGATPDHFSRGGIGAHFRHIVDHYDCFLSGVESGRVDYDRRQRDRESETRPAVCAGRIRSVIERLRGVQFDQCHRSLEVAMDSGERTRGSEGWSTTTVGRELQYLLSHTVHHFALIGVMLRLLGSDPGPDFGVAPSTLRYERTGDTPCAR